MSNIVKLVRVRELGIKNHHTLCIGEDEQYCISLTKEDDNIYQLFPSNILSDVIGIDVHTVYDLSFLNNPTLMKGTEYSDSNYDKLITRNPELFTLHETAQKTPYGKFNVWNGAVSRFNKDDISYFISYNLYERPTWIMESQNKLSHYIKFNFQWVLSPNTINKITKEINNKNITSINISLDNLNFYK